MHQAALTPAPKKQDEAAESEPASKCSSSHVRSEKDELPGVSQVGGESEIRQ